MARGRSADAAAPRPPRAGGDRSTWTRDDRERPLDRRGRAQARALVELFEPFSIDTIYSSPYRRCIETVEPLAAARGLPIEPRDELGEERQSREGIELVRSLAGADVVVCGHGGLEASVGHAPKWRKGTTLVVGDDLRVETVLEASG